MILLDAGTAVLTPMGAKLGKKAQARLQRIGVEIQLGVKVVDVDIDGLTVKDADGSTRRIESACKVWSAGVSASPLVHARRAGGAEIDRAGRVEVLPDLTIPGHPNVFVIGDMASVPGVPGMAQGAIQGESKARAIAAELTGRHIGVGEPFTMPRANRFTIRHGLHGNGVAVLGGRQNRSAAIERLLGWITWLLLHLVTSSVSKAK